MSDETKKTKAEKARHRLMKRAGHWRLPLSGHGESYFDELVVDYRTLPPHGAAEDPWSRAAAKADQAARAAADTFAVASQSAQEAAALAANAPGDEALMKSADAKKQLAVEARVKLDEANTAAAVALGAVQSKLAAAQIITELILKKERGHAVWSDILLFESALLRMLWFEPLKSRLLSLREEFRSVMGSAAAGAISANSLVLTEMTADKDFLRVQAEAVSLMSELHWQYLSAPRAEWQKTELSIALVGYALGLVAFILLCSVRSSPVEVSKGASIFQRIASLSFSASTASLVLVAGAAGATLSAFQRIQTGGASGAALLNLRSAPWHTLSVGVAPAIGALSAFLLTMMFAGGVVSGNLFPKIALQAGTCSTNDPALHTSALPAETQINTLTQSNKLAAADMTSNGSAAAVSNAAVSNNSSSTKATNDPRTWRDCETFSRHCWCVANGTDLALLLLWAFLAGFSERLVPDMLSRLAKRAEGKV